MVETSSYSSEFIALQAVTKSIKEIRNSLRSLGIEVRSPTRTRCDNRSMVCNNAQTDTSAGTELLESPNIYAASVLQWELRRFNTSKLNSIDQIF